MRVSDILSSELSDHFTWEEACFTSHRFIENTIPEELKPVIKFTAMKLERVRALLQEPIIVSSWYRCERLNRAVGGDKNSQHMRGEAVDFISPKYGNSTAIVRKISAYFDLIKYDQLILEHNWVHISFQPIPSIQPRGQVLTLLKNKKYAQGITDKFGNKL